LANIVVEVTLSALQYQTLYSGQAKNVVAHSLDGRKVQLPLSAFRRFVTHGGIDGFFDVEFDDQHKLVAITRIR